MLAQDEKNLRSFLSILDWMQWTKKPSHATVPLKVPKREIFVTEFFTLSKIICVGDYRTEPALAAGWQFSKFFVIAEPSLKLFPWAESTAKIIFRILSHQQKLFSHAECTLKNNSKFSKFFAMAETSLKMISFMLGHRQKYFPHAES